MTKKEIQANLNLDTHQLANTALSRILERVYQGGGDNRIKKQHEKGKLTARERIDLLFDEGQPRIEIGALAAYEMYEEYGGAPSAGVVVEIGYIEGKCCIVAANDATVKAGAWFPMSGKKNLRAQEIAMENRIPIIYLVDSAGVFLPMQDEIFPDKEHFGRIFRNNAIMSSTGIPQIAAIMGPCVAGGAYLPIMSDESLIVEGTGSIFLAAPHLVKAAIGEEVDQETLGGAHTQTAISGIVDHKVASDEECIQQIRTLVAGLGPQQKIGFNREWSPDISAETANEDVLKILPADSTKAYPMEEILKGIADKGSITYYKKEYGKSIICAYARIDGWSVGIVANSRALSRTATGEMQFGGVVYSDSADKAARFVMLCNQKQIPLVFCHDVTGFMVGKRSEHGGIIKDGAKLVNAVANSTVPKFTVIIGNSYGAGNYAMCGKAYDPRLIVAWPSAKVAVMGGTQAASVLTGIQKQAMEKKGETLSKEAEKELFDRIKSRYDHQTTPYYAAARLWVDAIIRPDETRKWISLGITMADHGSLERFNVGVLQV